MAVSTLTEVRTLAIVLLYASIYSVGKHALGDRARKLDQGILITRFELPFNIWWYVSMLSILIYNYISLVYTHTHNLK